MIENGLYLQTVSTTTTTKTHTNHDREQFSEHSIEFNRSMAVLFMHFKLTIKYQM